ncbi:Gfo/Idh/MocA family protein [Kitasatospora viridis]|uniref:Putative dehydrogenase n=1 Tax=Kitasatospora viridis TaxID=281105 RepID=A0A561SE66_9ACTN|nr:gfo/Idh/MocA family oxidoreductase [Kitasatospora viridis]TWF73166.1 putative dehydrogenase [Kitasatospora viridis]
MIPLRTAVVGQDHIHLPDHLAGLERAGATRCADPARADAIICGASTAERERMLPGLTRFGVPVLAEKPLAATAPATAALLRSAAAPVTTAMFLRCCPALAALRGLLATGRLGEPRSAELAYRHDGWLRGAFTGGAAWMADPARLPGGALADLGIHLVDLLAWLGPAPRGPRAVRVRRDRPGGAVLAGRAELGWGAATATLRTDWACRSGGLTVRITAARGVAEVRDGSLTLDQGRGPEPLLHGPGPAAADAVVAFLRQLRGGPRVLPEPGEIQAVAELMDQLLDAAGVTARPTG